MRYLSLLLTCCLLQACTTMASLSKPHEQAHFVLRKDYIRVERRGAFRTVWVFGLRAGTYRLVGEDDKGLYFLGQGGCAIELMDNQAKAFLRTGELPVAEQRSGGLVLPKPGVNAAPQLFVIQHLNSNGSELGVVGITIAALTENGLVYFNIGTEKDILGDSRVVSN